MSGDSSVVSRIIGEFKDMRDRHMKDEELQAEVSPFLHLDKSTVLQDCRVFHDANFVKMHPKRCCQHITRLLWFLNQGESLGGAESTEVFFGVTKLFQSTDGNLRRMVYLFLKEVADSTDSSNVIIVTQSLVKDMLQSDTPIYKANAMRVLSKIVDASMLGQLERYYKQALVDRDELVCSAALVSSLLLTAKPGCGDVISRWSNEVQTVLSSSKADMVAFHALALLRNVKRADKLAVSRVVQSLIKSGMRSALALTLLIRYASTLLVGPDVAVAVQTAALDFIDSCLRNKNEMVVYEAARALTSLPPAALGGRDMGSAITVLHVLLSSNKPAVRYAAVKTLNKLASSHSVAVAKCNDELESLIGDSNRVIGTLAITTLLKTGSEGNVERMLKSLGPFMGDVGSDELKVTVVQGIHELALRAVGKYRPIMSFLSNALRDEGGFEFKKAILDAMLDIMEMIPESKHEGLFQLCEFIEDCEFTALATRVLHLLGREGPQLMAPQPAAFIRFIYNRIILENAAVRASAVSALAKFATRCEDLRPQIIPLLQRCTDDDEDEVRDRATTYLRLLGAQPTLAAPVTLEKAGARADGGAAATAVSAASAAAVAPAPPVDAGVSRVLTSGLLPLPVASLSKALHLYQLRPASGPFSFDSLPHVEVPQPAVPPTGALAAERETGGYGYLSETLTAESSGAAAKVARAKARAATSAAAAADAAASGSAGDGAKGGAGGASAGAADSAAEALYRIPEFASFGALFRSSAPVELTERELEYLVSVQKHIFENHVVLAFTVTNTVPEMLLERVTVALSLAEGEPGMYKPVLTLACPRIKEGTPGTVYTALARNADAGFGDVAYDVELRFHSRECDPSRGYEPIGDAMPETYPVNALAITAADYVARTPVGDFRTAWEQLGAEGEVLESFVLSAKSVSEAAAGVFEALGLAPCENTGTVKAGATKHGAFLSGTFLGDVKVLARLQLTAEAGEGGAAGGGCLLKIAIRSEDRGVSELLLSTIS